MFDDKLNVAEMIDRKMLLHSNLVISDQLDGICDSIRFDSLIE